MKHIISVLDDRKIDQIEKHLSKLVDVAALQDITVNRHLEREVVLVKVSVPTAQFDDFQRITKVFNSSTINVSDDLYIVEMSGSSEKVDELVKSLDVFEIVELARSGAIGIASTEKSLAILGYGSQGHAHACNLNDSGVDVTVGLREGSSSIKKAEAHGLKVSSVKDAVAAADVVMVLTPDEFQKDLYQSEIEPNIKQGAALAFAHGFAIHYNQVV